MRKWIPLLIILAAVGASVVVYPKLPETIPTHWNMDGQPDGWSPRSFGAFITPVILLTIWGFILVMPAIDPRGANYAKFGGAFAAIMDSLMLFVLGMHILLLRAGLGHPVAMERVAPFGIGILLIVIGNLLPRARPNWFVGIRTPWTLSSDRVWEKTHRFGGRVFVAAGFLIAMTALLWAQRVHVVLIGGMLIAASSVLIYSYVEWRREQSPASPAS
jgi:uncharacterized membrane protein